jgi:hypothetical protein
MSTIYNSIGKVKEFRACTESVQLASCFSPSHFATVNVQSGASARSVRDQIAALAGQGLIAL